MPMKRKKRNSTQKPKRGQNSLNKCQTELESQSSNQAEKEDKSSNEQQDHTAIATSQQVQTVTKSSSQIESKPLRKQHRSHTESQQRSHTPNQAVSLTPHKSLSTSPQLHQQQKPQRKRSRSSLSTSSSSSCRVIKDNVFLKDFDLNDPDGMGLAFNNITSKLSDLTSKLPQEDRSTFNQIIIAIKKLGARSLKRQQYTETQLSKQSLLEKKIDTLQDTVDKMANDPQRHRPRSYADIISLPPQESSENIILIKPTKEGQNATDIRKSLHLVDTSDITITHCRPTKSGDFLIKCTKNKEIQTLKKRLENTKQICDNYKIEEKGPRPSRLIILRCPEGISEEQVMNAISKEIGSENEVQFKQMSNNNIIIETTPAIAQNLLDKGRLLLSFHSCPIRRYTPILRCYNCQTFGHGSKSCVVQQPICATCAENHDSKNCPKDGDPTAYNCQNCIINNQNESNVYKYDTKHQAYSKCCPTYQEFVKAFRKQHNS